MHGAKEGGREGYIERVRERGGRENKMEMEEAATDHPLG